MTESTENEEAVEAKPKQRAKKKKAKKAAAAPEDADTAEATESVKATSQTDSTLSVELTASLIKKLKICAQDEGVSLEDLVTELLAEGVVVRAWEIAERKSHLQQNGQANFRNSGGGNFRKGQNNNKRSGFRANGNKQGRRGQGGRNLNLDDKAEFLEYLRKQERDGRG